MDIVFKLVMVAVFFTLGYLFGRCIKILQTRTYGEILIDHGTEQCKVCLDCKDIQDSNKKEIVLKINHNATIPRQDQTLL